jgi:hypothetical protein
MDLNLWSFVLSVVGLALGLVSAYPQLRNFAKRTLKISTEGLDRWMEHLYRQADFYIAYPSALIAYISQSVFILGILFWLGIALLAPDSKDKIVAPAWVLLSLQLVFMYFLGKLGGDLLNTVRLVVRRAKQCHAKVMDDG